MLSALATAYGQSVSNPSFELNTFSKYPGYASDNGGVIAGWKIGGSPVPAPNAMVGLSPAGNVQTVHIFADNGAVPAGNRVAFIQSLNGLQRTLTGTILGPQVMFGTQSFYTLTAGSEYRVSFRANSRLETGIPNPTWSLNSGPFLPFKASPPVGGNNPFYTNTGVFTATNGVSVVTLANQTADDTAVLLDDFKVEEIPHYTWVLRSWNDDASTAIRPDSTLWAYHFGSSTATRINGVAVPGVPGPDPAVADRFEINGLGSTFSNHKNNLSNRGINGGGSAVMANDFIYNGNPGSVVLKGLKPGNGYVMSLFGVGFEGPGNRPQIFGAGSDSRILDEDVFGVGNGLRIDYAFAATNSVQSVSITPQIPGTTFHLYGLALRDGLTLGLNGEAAVTNECQNAYTESGAFSGPKAVAVGGTFNSSEFIGAAIRSDSTLVAWGAIDPQATTYSLEFSQSLSNILAIAAGNAHLLALRSDGTIALFQSDFNAGIAPTTVEGISDVTAIAAGAYHNVALRSDGSVATWGDNRLGQLNMFETFKGAQAVAAGAYHSMALRSDGTVATWGTWDSSKNLNNLKTVIRIAAGNNFCMALKQDGTVVTWGDMGPMPAAFNSAVVAIAAGASHCMALRSNGTVVVWRFSPSAVPEVPAEVRNIRSISAFGDTCMALGKDGKVFNWTVSTLTPPAPPASLYFQIPAPTPGIASIPGKPGTYTLTYQYTNSGGVGSISRTVTVVDTHAPEITLNGNPTQIVANGVYIELGATATDACGGVLPVTTNGTVNPLVAGVYKVVYLATDESGNTGSNTCTVVVQTAPSVVVLDTDRATPDLLTGISSLALKGAVNPNGLATKVVIEHGPTTLYGRTNEYPSIPVPPVGTDPGPDPKPLSIVNPAFFTGFNFQMDVSVGALAKYHWRMVAQNSLGTTASEDQSVLVGGVPIGLRGDLNSDNVVNVNDLKILLDSYSGPFNPSDLGALSSYAFLFPPFLGMTNVAGLGGTNVTFEAPAVELLGLRIESSTDLNTWSPLGVALPFFHFTDTNAVTGPQRFYRLSKPDSSD